MRALLLAFALLAVPGTTLPLAMALLYDGRLEDAASRLTRVREESGLWGARHVLGNGLLLAIGELPDGRPIVKASVRDIKQAATKVRAAEGKSKPLSAEAKLAQAEVKAVTKWLRERGAAKAKVSEARGKEGYVIRVELPVAAWSRLRSS